MNEADRPEGSGTGAGPDDGEDRRWMAHPVEPRPTRPSRPVAASAGPRPLVERVGMAAVALVIGSLFAGVSIASFAGGEVFLGVMGAVGCLMTLWVGAITLFRG